MLRDKGSEESQEVKTNARAGELSAVYPQSPLPSMSLAERIRADYAGTGLTIGPHPMAILRASLATRGVARAIDLPKLRAAAASVSPAPSSRASVPAPRKGLCF